MTDVYELFGDLKVLELSSVLAGPLVGSFFAELGASVTKIENAKIGGDVTRQWYSEHEDTSRVSSYYASANFKKEVIMMDLTDPVERKKLVNLVQDADIVISNFQTRVERKLELGYSDLVKINDKIIFVQLDAYSEADQRPGYDMVMQAETGFLSMTGTLDGTLVKMPVALIDVIAGHQMKEAVLIALLKKMKTGKGSHIRTSLYQSGVSALANQAGNYLNTGFVPGPAGTNHPNISIYGNVFKTSDNQLFILAVASDQQFQKLGNTLSISPDKLDYFCYNQSRLTNRQSVHDLLQTAIGKISWSDLKMKLLDNNIPFSVVYNLEDVFATPLARDMVNEFSIKGDKVMNVKNVAFKFKA